MRRRETMVRDRSADQFTIPVMTLPASVRATREPVRMRNLADNVVEIIDGAGRKRTITYQGGKVVRMETSMVSARGLHERVDQRKEDRAFVSAFVEPGTMPRVTSWSGDLLVRAERGLVNYVNRNGERLYETADGRVVQERAIRNGARVFAWIDRDGRVRSKQIHDAAGRRHFLGYDRRGLGKIRLHDGSELVRGPAGIWESSDGERIEKLDVMEDGSIRWWLDHTMYELRGDGTSAARSQIGDTTEFIRRDLDGSIGTSIKMTVDPTGGEKTVIRDRAGILSVRILAPRSDGGFDVRTLDRARNTSAAWRIANIAPPGKAPELDRLALLPGRSSDSRYVIATIDDIAEGIIYSFPDTDGMFLERTDGKIVRVA